MYYKRRAPAIDRPKIYLAGFDVFYPDAIRRGLEMKRMCWQYGFKGLFPLDNEITAKITGTALARLIFEGNINMIKTADIIVANLAPFRGPEPDPGTSFECGCAYMLGKPIYGYVPEGGTAIDRVRRHYGLATIIDNEGRTLDKNGMVIENFDLPLNLMLSVPADITVGSFADCLWKIAEDIRNGVIQCQ